MTSLKIWPYTSVHIVDFWRENSNCTVISRLHNKISFDDRADNTIEILAHLDVNKEKAGNFS